LKAQKGTKKAKDENIQPSQVSNPSSTNIYFPQPFAQPNLPYGFGNLMYPPGMMPMLPGYPHFNSFASPLPISAPPNPTPTATVAQPPPPSSPIGVGYDPVKLLEDYIHWHIRRSSSRKELFLAAFTALTDRAYEYADLATIPEEDWKDMKVKKGIYLALVNYRKSYKEYLRTQGDSRLNGDTDSDGGAAFDDPLDFEDVGNPRAAMQDA
jgi:hypothetical protein